MPGHMSAEHEEMWDKAKQAAAKEGKKGDWAYVQGIFGRMAKGDHAPQHKSEEKGEKVDPSIKKAAAMRLEQMHGGAIKDPPAKAQKHLTAKQREAIPTKDFALPGRRYPIEDKAHARNALARGAQHASPAELAKIKSKVRSKYPDIEVS